MFVFLSSVIVVYDFTNTSSQKTTASKHLVQFFATKTPQ